MNSQPSFMVRAYPRVQNSGSLPSSHHHLISNSIPDFIKNDVTRLYKDLLPHVKITLVEAGPALLGPFDEAMQRYAYSLFRKRDIEVCLDY